MLSLFTSLSTTPLSIVQVRRNARVSARFRCPMMSDHDAALLSNDIACLSYVKVCPSDAVHTKTHGACGNFYLGFRRRATTMHEVSLLTWHVRDFRITAAWESSALVCRMVGVAFRACICSGTCWGRQ